MITYLEWDSNFFGLKIGKLELTDTNAIFPKHSDFEDYDFIYIFSDAKLNLIFPLVDVKITFQKITSVGYRDSNIEIFDFDKHSYEMLLDLAYLSGSYSRFLRDSFFGEKKFKKLYKQWIDNSIEDKNTVVLVYVDKNRISGFVTCYKIDTDYSIGLIAVDSTIQGKGVGKKLISSVEDFVGVNKVLTVPTQELNEKACLFYKKTGFNIKEKKYIYHYAVNSI